MLSLSLAAFCACSRDPSTDRQPPQPVVCAAAGSLGHPVGRGIQAPPARLSARMGYGVFAPWHCACASSPACRHEASPHCSEQCQSTVLQVDTFNASARPLAHPPSPSPSPSPPPPPSCRSTTRRRRPTGGILSKTLRPTSGSTKKARARSSIRTPFFVLPGSSPARSSSDLTCPARHCTADAPAHIAHLIAGSVTHTHTHEQGACVVLIAVNLGLVLAVEVRANLNPKP